MLFGGTPPFQEGAVVSDSALFFRLNTFKYGLVSVL
jgi:hypothetical protein